MKMGGRVLAFNLDPGFANALDGLIVVDLRETPLAALERYMTRQGAAPSGTRSEARAKRRDESRRGRHECLRYVS
jgi:hypothetical protein